MTFKLQAYLRREVASLIETQLTGVQSPQHGVQDKQDTITLIPMQIRTFIATFATD